MQTPELSLERLKDLFFASESRGFRGYVFSFPLQQPPEERFRLVFRLSGPSHGFMWQLVGVELPARVRDQLVQQLARQEASALPR